MSIVGIDEVCKVFGITEVDFYNRLSNFEPEETRIEYRGCVTYLLTDGDCGALLIKGFSEIFEEEGASISLIEDCNYCDVDLHCLREIIEDLILHKDDFTEENEEY